MYKDTCPICNEYSLIEIQYTGYDINCKRCGNYTLTRQARHLLQGLDLMPSQKALISGYISHHQNENNHTYPKLKQESIENIINQPFPTPIERAEYILKYLCKKFGTIGHLIQMHEVIPDLSEDNICKGNLYGPSFSTTAEEINYLLNDYLVNKKLIEIKPREDDIEVKITPEGWSRYHDLTRNEIESKKVFIASWFNNAVDPFIKNVVLPTLAKTGFEPFWLRSQKTGSSHNEYIINKIFVEIRSSKFVIADLTSDVCKRKGKFEPLVRGGIYFEAGFAQGLGKEVIFTCRKDFETKRLIHFDLEQRNHIAWENGKWDEAKEKLEYNIIENFLKGKAPVL